MIKLKKIKVITALAAVPLLSLFFFPANSFAAGPAQQSSISSVTPPNCILSGTSAVTMNGLFPTLITSVTINGTAAAPGTWTQSPITATVNAVVSSTTPTIIQLFDGQSPVLAAQSVTCAPGAVVVPIPSNLIIPPGTGTIHVEKVVVSAYGGTATAADFNLSLKHWAVDVLGSPDVGLAAPGRTYVVAPGTYVLSEAVNPAFPDYISSFDIAGQSTNFIDLKPGDDITIMQTNTQLPPPVEIGRAHV